MPQPQIVFYELPDKDPQMIVRASCKLVSEYYRAHSHVHILTADESTLTTIDEMLWNYPANSFVPHMRASATQHGCLVTIECSSSFEGLGAVLINHTWDVPECIEQFERVCEFVLQHPRVKEQARSKFVRYREQYGKPSFVRLPDWDNRPILDY